MSIRLTKEDAATVVKAWMGESALRMHFVENRGHWEDILPVVIDAATRHVLECIQKASDEIDESEPLEDMMLIPHAVFCGFCKEAGL